METRVTSMVGDVVSIESDNDATKLYHIHPNYFIEHEMMKFHKRNLLYFI